MSKQPTPSAPSAGTTEPKPLTLTRSYHKLCERLKRRYEDKIENDAIDPLGEAEYLAAHVCELYSAMGNTKIAPADQRMLIPFYRAAAALATELHERQAAEVARADALTERNRRVIAENIERERAEVKRHGL